MHPGFWTRSWLARVLSADPIRGRRRRGRLGGRSLVRWVEGPLVSSVENMQISLEGWDRQCPSRRGPTDGYSGTHLGRGRALGYLQAGRTMSLVNTFSTDQRRI